MILTLAFWRAAGTRALRTILIAALPVLAPLIGGDWNTTRQALLALALAGVASLATSLVSLPELGGGRTRWHALVDRVARTFGQVVAATIVAGIAWGDVRWADLLVQATVAALGALLIGLTGTLPEVSDQATGRTGRYRPAAERGPGRAVLVQGGRQCHESGYRPAHPGLDDPWRDRPVGSLARWHALGNRAPRGSDRGAARRPDRRPACARPRRRLPRVRRPVRRRPRRVVLPFAHLIRA